jgi:hypothetical protein
MKIICDHLVAACGEHRHDLGSDKSASARNQISRHDVPFLNDRFAALADGPSPAENSPLTISDALFVCK